MRARSPVRNQPSAKAAASPRRSSSRASRSAPRTHDLAVDRAVTSHVRAPGLPGAAGLRQRVLGAAARSAIGAGLGRAVDLAHRHAARVEGVGSARRGTTDEPAVDETQRRQVRRRPARMLDQRLASSRAPAGVSVGRRAATSRSQRRGVEARVQASPCAPASSAGRVWMFRPPTWNSGSTVSTWSASVEVVRVRSQLTPFQPARAA